MRRVSIRLIPLVLMAIMFLTIGVTNVQATVEENWPNKTNSADAKTRAAD